MKELTNRQRQVLEFIQHQQEKEGLNPTFHEIAKHFRFKSLNAAVDHVRALVAKGRLRRSPRRARALQVVPGTKPKVPSLDLSRVRSIPIYGSIPAGLPQDGTQEQEGCVLMDVDTLGIKPTARTFGLKVRGDSMVGRHIVDGDVAIVEHGVQPRPGDVVAALDRRPGHAQNVSDAARQTVFARGKPEIPGPDPAAGTANPGRHGGPDPETQLSLALSSAPSDDSPRSIVHLDADAFFASVEQAADPRLRGKPVAVGGEKRGIIASASYEARQFGIYTPMPTAVARRLCPKLIVLPGDFEKYELFSRLMFSYAYDFTPDVEIGSIDEGYFDLTGVRKPAGGRLPRRSAEPSGNRSSSPSAKASPATNWSARSPPSSTSRPRSNACRRAAKSAFLRPLANNWLPGVGPKTARQLNAAGLARIGQIAHTPAELLGLLVGQPGAARLRKFRLGHRRPAGGARARPRQILQRAGNLRRRHHRRGIPRGHAAAHGRPADGQGARGRQKHPHRDRQGPLQRHGRRAGRRKPARADRPGNGHLRAADPALLRKAWQRRVSLRLVSLKLSNVYDSRLHGGLALDDAARKHEAQQRLADVVDELRQKFGRQAVLRGHDFRRCTKRNCRPGSQPEYIRRPILTSPRRCRGQQSAAGTHRRCLPERHDLGRTERGHPRPPVRTGQPGRRVRTVRQCPRAGNQSVPLSVHSYYSFLDSTLSVQAIVDLAKRHELPAIALTDRNNLHGAVEFAQAADRAGIQADPRRGTRRCRDAGFALYVENDAGYRNLCRILTSLVVGPSCSRQNIQSPVRLGRPRFMTLCLARLKAGDDALSTEGLLAVSPAAELARVFPGPLLPRDRQPAKPVTKGDRRALPCVAALPVHYDRPADRWKYDIVQSIRTLTLLRQAHPEKRLDGDYHFRTAGRDAPACSAPTRSCWPHSREIADRCDFAFPLGQAAIPRLRARRTARRRADFLRRLVLEGLRRRYPRRPCAAASADRGGTGHHHARSATRNISWWCGISCRNAAGAGIEWITRGSAADSLVCYCLGISGVCPIRFDLYFRRFLNKERMALNKLPDIDVDFPHDRKDDVVDLIFEKYGPAHTAVVGGFSTFQARSAFAEVAKVLGVSEFQVRRFTERFPHFARRGELAEAIAESQECRDLPLDQEPYRTALEMAQFLDGFPRYPKMHPCGLVLSRQPMDELTPCFHLGQRLSHHAFRHGLGRSHRAGEDGHPGPGRPGGDARCEDAPETRCLSSGPQASSPV